MFASPFNAKSQRPGAREGWTRKDLERDRRWSIELDEASRNVLADVLATPRQWCDGEDILPESVTAHLHRALGEASDGFGFAVLRGLPIDAPMERLEQMVRAFGRYLGRLMPQNPAGELLIHVMDRNGLIQGGIDEAKPGVCGSKPRGYLSNEPLGFHSDTADMLALFCVRPARAGGETTLVSAISIYEALSSSVPNATLALLEQGFRYGYPEILIDPNAALGPLVPVFSQFSGRVSCRYLRAFIELAQKKGDFTLSMAEIAALDQFDATAAEEALQFCLTLVPGDFILINNYAVLHARSSFEDYQELEKKRLLLRLWLNIESFRPVIPIVRAQAERFVGAEKHIVCFNHNTRKH
ncbi:MAG: TauD/TfdA family dioxygenase [Nostoc sp. DedSLP03]|uniref:TauD/TfdA family dioxygenase n=1 Tax=Nostoc sp. DedSLP03 TaxID=3075400 RepID=UPI002AD5A302|nr:TauD/TfdA family dioxygenase [Nostoc sp. DedSLP03]MDZ7970270.1 TauD/TfdA family dioxygenase [Nostoc sp. DedSLP03]